MWFPYLVLTASREYHIGNWWRLEQFSTASHWFFDVFLVFFYGRLQKEMHALVCMAGNFSIHRLMFGWHCLKEPGENGRLYKLPTWCRSSGNRYFLMQLMWFFAKNQPGIRIIPQLPFPTLRFASWSASSSSKPQGKAPRKQHVKTSPDWRNKKASIDTKITHHSRDPR